MKRPGTIATSRGTGGGSRRAPSHFAMKRTVPVCGARCTRARISQSARRWAGKGPSRTARALSGGHASGVLGLVVDRPGPEPLRDRPFFMQAHIRHQGRAGPVRDIRLFSCRSPRTADAAAGRPTAAGGRAPAWNAPTPLWLLSGRPARGRTRRYSKCSRARLPRRRRRPAGLDAPARGLWKRTESTLLSPLCSAPVRASWRTWWQLGGGHRRTSGTRGPRGLRGLWAHGGSFARRLLGGGPGEGWGPTPSAAPPVPGGGTNTGDRRRPYVRDVTSDGCSASSTPRRDHLYDNGRPWPSPGCRGREMNIRVPDRAVDRRRGTNSVLLAAFRASRAERRSGPGNPRVRGPRSATAGSTCPRGPVRWRTRVPTRFPRSWDARRQQTGPGPGRGVDRNRAG